MDTASLRIAVQTSDVKKANDELNQLSKTSGKTEQNTNKLTKSFDSLSATLGTIGVAALTREFIKIADEMSMLDARLKMVSSSTAEYVSQKKELLAISKETYSSISEITTLYTKLDPALKALGATTKDVNNITESFAKGLKLGGANTAEAASATLQFAQAMGSGVLRGEEFNAIMEASPKLMSYLAEGLGVPQTALRKMAMEGELSAGRVSAALLKMTTKINEDFTQIPITVGMATTNLRTDLAKSIEEFDKATGATKALAETISGLSVDLTRYGTDITTFFVSASKFIEDHNDALRTTAALVGGVATAYYGFIAGGAVISGIGGITTAIYELRTAMIALQASSPILLAISAGLGVATAAYLAHDDALEKKNYSTINSIDSLVKSHERLLNKRKEIQSDKFALDSTQKKETAIVDAELKKIENRLNQIGTARSKNIDKAKQEAEEIKKSAKAIEESSKKLAPAKEEKKKKGKSDAEIAAEKEAELRAKINHKIAVAEFDTINRITKARQDALENQEQAEIDMLNRMSEMALKIYESTITETEKLNTQYMDIWETSGALFDQDQLTNFFTKWQESIDGVKGGYDEVNQIVSEYGASSKDWTAGLTGQARAVANIGNAFADIEKDQMAYAKATEKINKSEITAEQKQIKLKELETKHLQNQVGVYANLAGSMSSFFREGSKEAAAFQLIQTTLATISGVTAILEQGKGDPYTAFPRMAAMSAAVIPLVASIGGAIKAFSGNKVTTTYADSVAAMSANTGTGSVLGDASAVSESMINSLELLSDYAKPEFQLSSQMARSLQSIDAKIGGVTTLLLRQGGFAFGEGYQGFDTGYKNNIGSGASGLLGNAASVALMGMGTGAALGLGSWAAMGSFGPLGIAAYAVDKLLFKGTFSNMIGGIMGSVIGGIFGKKSVSRTMTDSGIYFADALLKSAIEDFQGSAYQTIATTVTKKSWVKKSSSTTIQTYFGALDDEVERQFSLVLKGLYDTTVMAGGALDKSASDIEASLSNFVVSIGKISFQGKTGDQIQETISNIFGRIGDDIAKTVFPLLTPFQKVGEGMFETMTRVASGMEQAGYYIDRLGKSFNDVIYSDLVNKQGDVALEALRQSILNLEGTSSGVSQIIQSLTTDAEELYSTYVALDRLRFDLSAIGTSTDALTASMLYGAGGIGALSDATQSYIDNYLTESEQVAYNTAVMTDAFNDLGLTIPTTKQGFTDLLKSIDVTTESGQDLYGRLILLSEGFNELVESSDKLKSSLFENIQNFIDKINGELRIQDTAVSFRMFSTSFNDMIDAIENGSDNLLEVGNTALSNAQSYLDTVTATATAGRDIAFAKAMLVNKFSGVIARPDTTLSTINNTLNQNNAILVSELQALKFELNSLKNMTIDQRATSENQLSTMRAILGEVSA